MCSMFVIITVLKLYRLIYLIVDKNNITQTALALVYNSFMNTMIFMNQFSWKIYYLIKAYRLLFYHNIDIDLFILLRPEDFL